MTNTSLVDVSAFKGVVPAQAFQVLDPQAESLADGIGQSYGIVGYKGKVWSLRLRGNTYQFNRADDGSPEAFLDVIILRSPSYKSKSFYPPGSFQDGQIGVRPVCASLDGVQPDIDIATPECTACAICPRNAFKVNPDGRKTRDCSDYKRLAVLILPSVTKRLLGAALMEPVFLRIPPASLNDLAQLGEQMQAMGFHYSSYITRIGFNPDKPHPQMTFRALQALTDREAPVVLPMRDDPQAMRITGENEIGKPRPAGVTNGAQGTQTQTAAPQQAQAQQVQQPVQPQPQARPVQTQTVAPQPQARPQQPAQLDTGFGDVGGGNATVTATVSQPQQNVALDTGFGDVGQTTVMPQQQVQQAQPQVNTTVDTGAPDESDADLDAMVANLLPKVA
jgi:hypothetical protein